MTKYILTGIDGNLGSQAAKDLMNLTDKKFDFIQKKL